MSAYRKATPEELTQIFERSLRFALAGMTRTCTPLDSLTLDALRDLASAFPVSDQELVRVAREAFAEQLAGANADDSELPKFMR